MKIRRWCLLSVWRTQPRIVNNANTAILFLKFGKTAVGTNYSLNTIVALTSSHQKIKFLGGILAGKHAYHFDV